MSKSAKFGLDFRQHSPLRLSRPRFEMKQVATHRVKVQGGWGVPIIDRCLHFTLNLAQINPPSSDEDCPISLKFGTEVYHVTADTINTSVHGQWVKGQGHMVKCPPVTKISVRIGVAESNGVVGILMGSSEIAVSVHVQYKFGQKH